MVLENSIASLELPSSFWVQSINPVSGAAVKCSHILYPFKLLACPQLFLTPHCLKNLFHLRFDGIIAYMSTS